MRLIPLFFLLACGGSTAVGESVCPEPTESCMNEDNHQECLDVEAECPGEVAFLESCPLQFACGS